MTPPATARSTRRSTAGSRAVSGRRPRRISGPSASTRSGALATAVAIPAPGIALPHERKPRPSSVPRKRPARKVTRRAGQGAPGIALRAIDAVDGVSSSAFLDRLIRGRLWIVLLALALIGIVVMQLLVLKLNTGIGRTLGRVETLQRENAQLGIEDSMYSAESRVAPLAAAEGMTLAPPGTVHFVIASKADISRAAAALSTAGQISAGAPTQAGPSETGESTASPGSGAQAQTSADSGSQAASSGAAATTSESSGSAGSGSAGAGSDEADAGPTASAGSSESSSADGPSSAPTAASVPSTPTSSATGIQPAGASTTPSSSEAASAQSSGPGGGTQAGTRE